MGVLSSSCTVSSGRNRLAKSAKNQHTFPLGSPTMMEDNPLHLSQTHLHLSPHDSPYLHLLDQPNPREGFVPSWYVFFSFFFVDIYVVRFSIFSGDHPEQNQARIFFLHRQFLSDASSINHIESTNDCFKFPIFSSSTPPPPLLPTYHPILLSSRSTCNLYFATRAFLSHLPQSRPPMMPDPSSNLRRGCRIREEIIFSFEPGG